MLKQLLFLLLYFVALPIVFAQTLQPIKPITPDLLPKNGKIALDNQHHLLLADTMAVLDIEQVSKKLQHKFAENNTKVFGFDEQVQAWWLLFKLQNTSTEKTTFYLLSGEDAWADTQFFYYGATEKDTSKIMLTKLKGGWLNADTLRNTDDLTDALAITLQAGEEKTIYIRRKAGYVQPKQAEGIVQYIANEAYFKALRQQEITIFMVEAIFFGLVLIMTLYNLMLFFATKDLAYFYYVWLMASFGFSFSEDTLYVFFSDDNKLFYYRFIDLLNALAVLFNVLFIHKFLDTKTKYITWYWLLNLTTIIPIIKCFLIVFDLLSPQVRHFYIENLFIPNTILHLFFVLLLGIFGTKQKDKNASLFLISGICLLFSLLVWNVHLLLLGDVLLNNLYGFWIYLSPKISFVAMALWFSRHLTMQLRSLQQAMIQQKLAKEVEIRQIFEQQNVLLEQQVQQRTTEIEQQKEEIETQRDALALQNIRISKQHDDITSSIKAAKRIQSAMLPLAKDIAKALPEHFIFFRPRDVVSGDFYWFANLSNKITVIVAADCTGHGVPGAFMSMIGNELLNEIVKTEQITEANQILTDLHTGVLRVLQQEETDNRDGMDLALCVIRQGEKEEKTVLIDYAGANNPLYFVQFGEGKADNHFTEVKADKMPIGGTQYENSRFTKKEILVNTNTLKPLFIEQVIENQAINVCANTTFYLFSDGYQDQFGGEKNKKFMVKKLKELLTSLAHLEMEQQKELLAATLNEWQGKYQQVDDILMIGFRV
jgi:two-component system, sensor histidine kinase LadS